MSDLAHKRMTSYEFIDWAMAQPEHLHYELAAGQIVEKSREPIAHVRAKMQITLQMTKAIEAAHLACEAYPSGMAVEIDDATVYEPDALVRCGPRLCGDTLKLRDPIIVVEVLTPSSRARDTGAKLADYFRLASLRHYLIARTEDRTIIHHRRADDGAIATTIIRNGPIRLDPPASPSRTASRRDATALRRRERLR